MSSNNMPYWKRRIIVPLVCFGAMVVCIAVPLLTIPLGQLVESSRVKPDTEKLHSLICEQYKLGKPFVREQPGNPLPEYFCEDEQRRLHRVINPNLDFNTSALKETKYWGGATEVCQKAGFSEPALVGLGFYCRAENGEYFPVRHPNEK